MKRSEDFETDNLQLAGYLTAKGIELMRVERSGRFGLFYFHGDQARPEAAKFVEGLGSVEPRRYTAAIRELRAKVDALREGDRQ
jgi:hypothetical protein